MSGHQLVAGWGVRVGRLRNLLADTRPLQYPEFRRLFIGQTVTVIGSQITVIVVPAQIYHITQNSAYVGIAGLFGLVPLVVFGLWGGALADFFDRRLVLLWSTWGLIGSAAALAVQAFAQVNNVWLLMSIFAVQQACFAIAYPARSAILPRILPAELLPAASALTMTVFTFGAIAGPMLGGALIPVLGYGWLYTVDAVSFLATVWAAYTLPPIPIERTVSAAMVGLRSVLDGFRYLTGHPILLSSFVIDLIAMVFGLPRALFPEIAHTVFSGPAEGGLALAVLSAGIAIGAATGGVFSGWVSRVRRHGAAVVLAILIWGVAMVAFGVTVACAPGPWAVFLWLGVFALAIGGAADIASSAFRTAMLQESATDEMRGRLQGVFIVVVAGGPRLADILHGSVAVLWGPAVTITLGGGLVVVCTLVMVRLVPSFWQYRSGAADQIE